MGRYYVPDDNNEHQPVTWLNGHAIYAAHFVVVVFVASMLVTTLLMFFNAAHLLTWLEFDSTAVFHGQVWRVFSFGLVNEPSLNFAFDMLWIIWAGREVEKFFGRRKFLMLYAIIYLLTPALLSLISLRWPMQAAGERGALALFVAFATLYPDAELMFGILAKWAAVIVVGIFTLMSLASHDVVSLITLWGPVGFAYAFVRHEQGRLTLPRFRLPRRQPQFRVLPDVEEETRAKAPKDDAMIEVDALLDKIARSGINSLSANELAQLDEARARLRKKASQGR
jgi:membrane associated rhomboid family serine protease